jgi:hypothetical protein
MPIMVRDRRRWFLCGVVHPLVVGVFWDLLSFDSASIRFRPLGRRGFSLDRSQVDRGEFERWWVPPFVSKTVVWVRLNGGDYAPKVVVPLWAPKLRRALEEEGWPVVGLQVGEVVDRPRRGVRELRGG